MLAVSAAEAMASEERRMQTICRMPLVMVSFIIFIIINNMVDCIALMWWSLVLVSYGAGYKETKTK